MKYGWMAAALLPWLVTTAGWAGEGVLSQQKLAKLGLSSLQIASDQQGEQVRGKQYILVIYTLRQQAGAVMDPPIANDIGPLGTPLTFGPATFVTATVDPPPVNDGMGTMSDTGFTVSVGSASLAPLALFPPLTLPPFP